MTTNELKNLIEAGHINWITLYGTFKNETDDKMQWSIHVYDHEGETTVSKFGTVLINTSRDKRQKQYTSLDRAYEALRGIGYQGKIEIDG